MQTLAFLKGMKANSGMGEQVTRGWKLLHLQDPESLSAPGWRQDDSLALLTTPCTVEGIFRGSPSILSPTHGAYTALRELT